MALDPRLGGCTVSRNQDDTAVKGVKAGGVLDTKDKGLGFPCNGYKKDGDMKGDRSEGYETRNNLGNGEQAALRRPRRHVLVSTSSEFAHNVVPFLTSTSDIELRLICDHSLETFVETYKIPCYTNDMQPSDLEKKTANGSQMKLEAARLGEWADLLIAAPMDAGTLGSMLAGLSSTLTLTILRGWDVNKPTVLIPSMTTMEWRNPMTERQLDEISNAWPWVSILPPLLSRFEAPDTIVQMPWEGLEALKEVVRKETSLDSDKEAVTKCTNVLTNGAKNGELGGKSSNQGDNQIQGQDQLLQQRHREGHIPKKLPLELLLIVFEQHLADWEIVTSVGIHSNLPVPQEWAEHFQNTDPATSLEYTILQGSFEAIKECLVALPRWKPLSNLASHLIFKFSRTDILTYLSESHMDLFWTTSHLTQLPLRASSIYDNPAILTWWRDCPALPTKDYQADAVDGASRAGFVHVLEWWRTSGLPLLYTERSLESASAEGHIPVLEWWKNTSANAPVSDPIPLKTGKSILLAAQSGRTSSLAWWDASGIPYTHSDSVTRIASTHGHVPVLALWHHLKGPKLIFDNQVLVGATKNGHVDVLEWWRRSGLRVEFKTCDIEEALEDAVSGSEERVRQWWHRNGLNLGVGTSEWMKVKVL